MKAVILAAGYATRLYPLTLDRPKALLPVGGRPMVEHLLLQLEGVEGLDAIYLVTNSKFAGAFREWAAGWDGQEVQIVDDGTGDEESKLGAIGDLDLTIRSGWRGSGMRTTYRAKVRRRASVRRPAPLRRLVGSPATFNRK